jgi:hypothetical protein
VTFTELLPAAPGSGSDRGQVVGVGYEAVETAVARTNPVATVTGLP